MNIVICILLVSKVHARFDEVLKIAKKRNFSIKTVSDRKNKLTDHNVQNMLFKDFETFEPKQFKKFTKLERFNTFLTRWEIFSEIAMQPYDYFIFIRSDLYIDLEEFNDQVMQKPVLLLRNFKIFDPKIPFLRKFFLENHIFDGVICGKTDFFRRSYYLIRKSMEVEASKERSVPPCFSKLFLNIPKVHYCKKPPEYYLNKVLSMYGRDSVCFLVSKTVSWHCYKPLGHLDNILRYPYFKKKI